MRCYGEHAGEHIGTRGNFLKPSPPQNLKGKKKARHLECLLGPSHWLHEISLPKRVCHYFWRGLIPLAKNTLHIECQPTLGTYCDSYYLVHGCVHNFFSFCGKSHIHWPINNVFWSIEHSPMEAPLWTSQLQNRNECISQQPVYLLSLYTWELNLGQTLWDKIKVLLEPQGNKMRTCWEHIGNQWQTINRPRTVGFGGNKPLDQCGGFFRNFCL